MLVGKHSSRLYIVYLQHVHPPSSRSPFSLSRALRVPSPETRATVYSVHRLLHFAAAHGGRRKAFDLAARICPSRAFSPWVAAGRLPRHCCCCCCC